MKIRIPVNSGDPNGAQAITLGVDAVDVHPGFFPDVPKNCCGGDPSSCAQCMVDYGDRLHDVALVHLEQPAPNNIPTLPILAQLGPAGPPGRFPVDFASLTSKTATIVGTSLTTSHPSQSWRAYGNVNITGVDDTSGGVDAVITGCQTTPPFTTVPQPCASCYLFTDSTGGKACGVPGDSGGPIVLNATSLGASSVPGLGAQMVIAAVLSTGSNGSFSTSCSNSTDFNRYTSLHDFVDNNNLARTNGTWILKHVKDWDGDGWEDDKDNCPLVANPDQANCNSDSESKWGYPARGDLCDPIPCPPAKFVTQQTEIGRIANPYFDQTSIHAIKSSFAITPLGSNYFGNGSSLGIVRGALSIGSATTSYRDCQKDPVVPINCGPSAIDDFFLNTQEGIPSNSRPYHLAHVGAAPNPPNTWTDEPLTYPSSATPRVWNYVTDCTNWVANGWINFVSCSGPTGSGLDGRFWTHADTTLGTYGNQVGTGYRVKNDGVTADGSQLTNNYNALTPDVVVQTSIQGKPLARAIFFKWWVYQDIASAPPLWDGGQREVTFIVPTAGTHYGIVRHNGYGENLDAAFASGLEAAFANGSLFAGAVEPTLGFGPQVPPSGYQALIVAADGTDVVDAVGYDSSRGVLGTTADLGQGPPSRSAGPARRIGFAAVYSRVEDRAFIVGGADAGTGLNFGDIWVRDVTGPAGWAQVALRGYAPQAVLAATWSFADRRLWILDRTTDGSRLVRLARVEPDLGHTQVVGQWSWTGTWDKQYLEVDSRGQILLSSSSAANDQYAVAQFQVVPFAGNTPVSIDRFQILPSALALPPIADLSGVSFHHWDARNALYVVERRDTVPGTAQPLSVLSTVL